MRVLSQRYKKILIVWLPGPALVWSEPTEGKRWAVLDRSVGFGRRQPLAMVWRNMRFQRQFVFFLLWNVLIVSKGSLLDLFKNTQGKILLSVDVWTAAHGKKKVGFLQFLIYFSFLCKLHKRWQTMCAFLYSPAHSHSNKLTGLSPSYRWVKSHGTKIIIFKQFEVHFFRGLPLPSPSKI